MKITGAEWKKFERDGWPEGYVWADESTFDDERDLYAEDGSIIFGDSETFSVPAYWSMQFEGPEGTRLDSGDGLVIRSVIKKWRAMRDKQTVVVSVPNADLESFRTLCKEKGWMIS